MKKRILALCLILCMLLPLLTSTAAAESAIIASGYYGPVDDRRSVQWTLDTSGELKFSGTGLMDDAAGGPWMEEENEDGEIRRGFSRYYEHIKTVTICDGITYIGLSAFEGFTNLSRAYIAPSVRKINTDAFKNCGTVRIYFEGDAPSVYVAEQRNASFSDDVVLYYRPGYSGWTDSSAYDADSGTWNGYRLERWSGEKRFTLQRDNNSFTNAYERETDGFYQSDRSLPFALYNKLVRGHEAFPSILKIMMYHFCQLDNNGWCHGIATSMALVYSEKISLRDISSSGAKDYYHLPLPYKDEKLKNSITYYQLSQYVTEDGTASIGWAGRSSVDALKKLVELLQTEDVAVFGYGYKGSADQEEYAHAILAYGSRKNQDGSYTVKLYDTNTPNWSKAEADFCDMRIESDFSSFSFKDVIGSKKGFSIDNSTCRFFTVNRTDELFQDAPYGSTVSRTHSTAFATYAAAAEDVTLQIPFNTCGTITAEDGSTLTYDADGFSGSMQIISTDVYVSGESSAWILRVPYSTTFQAESDSACFGLTAYAGEHFLSVHGQGIQNAKLSFADGIVLNDSAEGLYNFEAFISTEVEIDDYENNLIALSGATEGKTVIANDASSGLVTAESDAPIREAEGYSLIRTDVVKLPDLSESASILAVSSEKPEVSDIPATGEDFLEALLPAMTMLAAGSDKALPFCDVPRGSWYYRNVEYGYRKGWTEGMSEGRFEPDALCTRAQAITFLYRAAGQPEATIDNPFVDVTSDAYYYDALLWGVSQGILTGTSENTFSPDDICRRGQFVSMLYRFAGEPDTSGIIPFTDVQQSDFFSNAVCWAQQNNIATGTGMDRFSPSDACSRAQIMTFLVRLLGR